MNPQMAYLLGMILGNGEIQRGNLDTTITIDIPHKNLIDDEGRDVQVYVSASVTNIREIIEPLVGSTFVVTQDRHSTRLSFTKLNQDYTMREIMRFIESGTKQTSMTMNPELFDISVDEKKELLRGIADVTGHIRRSNAAFGNDHEHRVYIEIPANWQMVIDIANMLKDLDIPIQTINFGHPNFRDSNLRKYNEGKPLYWKKEHQIKIYANEFLPIGFNIVHKQRSLETLAAKNLKCKSANKTHLFYWEKPIRRKTKPYHPGEDDPSLPDSIRGQHFESWTDLARELGYHE